MKTLKEQLRKGEKIKMKGSFRHDAFEIKVMDTNSIKDEIVCIDLQEETLRLANCIPLYDFIL